MQQRLMLFGVVTLLLILVWMQIRPMIWPPPKPEETPEQAKKEPEPRAVDKPTRPEKAEPSARRAAPPGPVALLKEGRPEKASLVKLTPPPKDRPAERQPAERFLRQPAVRAADGRLKMGDGPGDEKFFLIVGFDKHGAAVRSVTLKDFQAADARGRPVWTADRQKAPLELVPDAANRIYASFLLYHFGSNPARRSEQVPLETLGGDAWELIDDKGQVVKEGEAVRSTTTPDGRREYRISFRTLDSLTDRLGGVQLTKTFSLAEGDYHVGLDVRLDRRRWGKGTFRYQLAGAHGLPIEGRWYTSKFRDVMLAQVAEEGGRVEREITDLRQTSLFGGSDAFQKKDGYFFRYAGVAIQYFASVIVVSDEQDEGVRPNFLATVRATLETGVTRGTVKSVATVGDRHSFVLEREPDGKLMTFQVFVDPDRTEPAGLPEPGKRIGVVHFADNGAGKTEGEDYRAVQWALRWDEASRVQPLWESDVKVRVNTAELELEYDRPVTHRYLLYHGPVKPSLLGLLHGARTVRPELVTRYSDTLVLKTLVDYPSPGFFGAVGSWTFFTPLVIFATNIMHWVLAQLHRVVPSYGLCIILLTVLVRGLMFPISRKQAMTTLKMQALAPELKKLHEKYKDDRQAMGMAQMELYRKHGINPFGSCLWLILQMPIYMGLYYAFQESISFRLADFWPLWIQNLAAPDMLFEWGEGVPWLSTPESYGSFIYLGPYFNILPLIAVALMLWQQKVMSPPPTDEQQEMQMKMLRYMTVFFGLLFYKVAAGLCVYFIASGLWGFAERALLPRKKLPGAVPEAEGQPASTPASSSSPASPTEGRKGGKKGRNKRRREEPARQAIAKAAEAEEPRGWWSGLRQWWAEVLKQAEKKGR